MKIDGLKGEREEEEVVKKDNKKDNYKKVHKNPTILLL